MALQKNARNLILMMAFWAWETLSNEANTSWGISMLEKHTVTSGKEFEPILSPGKVYSSCKSAKDMAWLIPN